MAFQNLRLGEKLVARSFFIKLVVVRIFTFSLCLALSASAFGTEINIDFGDFSSGEAPSGFHKALAGGGQPGDWKIVMDSVPSVFAPLTPQAAQAAATSKRPVLAQLSEDPTDERFPMLIFDKETFKNFKLVTQFKIVSGVAEQMAGVVFRFQNESNFYVVRASALGHNFRFYKVVDGVRSMPIGPTLDISTNVWHSLAVQCQGNQITCWLDDHLAMPPLNDNTFDEGKIGFWTKSDAVSYFGNTTIDYTPIVPMAQTVVDDIMKKQPRILELRIYTLDAKGEPHVLASNNKKEIGMAGTDAEKKAITDGLVFFGRGRGTVALTLPLRDRNGNPMAAMRVQFKSFLGETQDIALARAMDVLKLMQLEVTTSDELMQ